MFEGHVTEGTMKGSSRSTWSRPRPPLTSTDTLTGPVLLRDRVVFEVAYAYRAGYDSRGQVTVLAGGQEGLLRHAGEAGVGHGPMAQGKGEAIVDSVPVSFGYRSSFNCVWGLPLSKYQRQ